MELEGTYAEVVSQISSQTGIEKGMADALLGMIFDNPSIADRAVSEKNDQFQSGSSELVFGNERYHISVKRSVIAAILLALPAMQLKLSGIDYGSVLTAVTTLAGAHGAFKDLIVELDEKNGEKCILLETLKNKRRSINAEILKKQIGSKCEKQYRCDYKKNGRCLCSEEKIEKILETLKAQKILDGGPAGYKYVW